MATHDPSPYASFLADILAGNRRRAYADVLSAHKQHGLLYVYESIVRPALNEVGECWAHGTVATADEHLATATAQSAIAELYGQLCWLAPGPRKALIACVEGERHDFGARMLADVFALEGYEDYFLGADVPTHGLVQKAWAVMPDVVMLSVSLAERVPALCTSVRALRTRLASTKILVGGRALARMNDAQAFGADAIAHDLPSALRLVRRWQDDRERGSAAMRYL
jgi:methanogenic corrinoid protein MtbC1